MNNMGITITISWLIVSDVHYPKLMMKKKKAKGKKALANTSFINNWQLWHE